MKDELKKEVRGYNLYGEKIFIPADQVPFRPSGYGLIVNDGKIALVNSRSTGRYFFPGGGIKQGETMEEGMRREVKEETGLEIVTAELVDANDIFFEYTPTKRTFHSIQFFYLCTVNSTELVDDDKVDDGEAETPRWIEISSLKNEDFQEHGSNVIDRILQKLSNQTK